VSIAVELARAIGRMPAQLTLIGIEAGQTDWAARPSAPVDAAIDAVVDLIVGQIARGRQPAPDERRQLIERRRRNQAADAESAAHTPRPSEGSEIARTLGRRRNVRRWVETRPTSAVFLVVVAMRFVIPLFIPRFPLPAILAALVIDAADQTIFQQFTNLNLDGYQNYDKALDIFYLTIAFLAVYRNWTNTVGDQRGPVPLVLPALRRLAVRGLPGTMDPVRVPEHLRVLLHRVRRDRTPNGTHDASPTGPSSASLRSSGSSSSCPRSGGSTSPRTISPTS
jgi:hypothetical protein